MPTLGNRLDPVIAEVSTMASAFPDLTLTIRRQLAPNDMVSIIEYTFGGTHRGDLEGLEPLGREISVVACSVLDAEGVTVAREADYYDTAALMAQLGQ